MSERMQLRGGVKRHCLGKEQNAVTKNAVGRADCPHENGYYAHPEYVSAAIQSFAQMPITSYLSEYPDRLKKNLSACVGITEKDAGNVVPGGCSPDLSTLASKSEGFRSGRSDYNTDTSL